MIGWTCQGTFQCCPCLKVMRAKSSTLARKPLGVRGLRHVPPQRTARHLRPHGPQASSPHPRACARLRSITGGSSKLHHSTLHLERPFTTGSRPNINGIRSWACAGHRPPRDNGQRAIPSTRRTVDPSAQLLESRSCPRASLLCTRCPTVHESRASAFA